MKWDYDKELARGYLSSDEILDQVKNSGKIEVPSSDFILPPEIFQLKASQNDAKLMGRKIPSGSRGAVNEALWDVASEYEPKAYQALSQGIRDAYGFTPKHKIKDISKEIANSMGIPDVPINIKYSNRPAAGMTDYEQIFLNPEHLHIFGKESVIAHELRHIKEGEGSSGFTLGKPREGIYGLLDSLKLPEELKRLEGKELQQFQGGGKFKQKINVLDILDFFEGKHFKDSFLKENLKRVSKKLPIIGVAGALLSPSADAAVADMVIPGGVSELGVSDEQKALDNKYRQRIKELQERNSKK